MLVRTKKDLKVEFPLKVKDLFDLKEQYECLEVVSTSSKKWQDWNVHKAF